MKSAAAPERRKAITVRDLRICAGLSQRELANKARLNPVHYCRIENGKHPGLRTGTMRRLAVALDLPITVMVRALRATNRQVTLVTTGDE